MTLTDPARAGDFTGFSRRSADGSSGVTHTSDLTFSRPATLVQVGS